MHKITEQKMRDFIMAQPDDRPVKMSTNVFHHNKDKCGCLMVEYVKDLFEVEKGKIFAGFSTISVGDDETKCKCVAELDFGMHTLIDCSFKNPSKTFGELKKCLL